MESTSEVVDFEKAQKFESKIIEKLQSTKRWEDNFGGGSLYEKLDRARDEVIFLLYRLRLIEDYRYSELSWQSRYRVNIVSEKIFELIETDQEEN